MHTNWFDNSEISKSLFQNESYLKQMALGQPVTQLLVGYVERYQYLMNKSQIEWQLAEHSWNDFFNGQVALALPDGFSLPNDLLTRYSGAMLWWLLAQGLRKPYFIPGVLASLPPLTAQQALMFARGWALWPQNPALLGRSVELFEWLKPNTKALGWAAIALAGAGNLTLAQQSAQSWLDGALESPQMSLLNAMLEVTELRDEGWQALRRAMMRYRNNEEMLEQLAFIAFENDYDEQALQAAELLLSSPKHKSQDHNKLDAIRIAALIRLDHKEAALTAYRQRWYQKAALFPYPHILLPTMTSPDVTLLREYLLKNYESSDEVPTWVHLEALDLEGRWQKTLSEWHQLLKRAIKKHLPAEQVQDDLLWTRWPKLVEGQVEVRHFLMRLTDVVLKAEASQAGPYQAYVQTLWKALVGEKEEARTSHRGLFLVAQSALVLLEASAEDRIARYQTHLLNAPLSLHLLTTRAARAYIEVLVSRKRWHQLVQFSERKDLGVLRQVCTYEEYHFFQGMIEVESKEPTSEEWCYLWEELISLPLQDGQVQAAIEHFVNIRQELRRDGHSIVNHERFRDVELQLTRRGKAVGERWLRQARTSEITYRKLRENLITTRLNTLSQVLEHMKPYLKRE